MNYELETLTENDPRLKSYLDGTFSKTHRAIPVLSLNVNPESRQVTFKVIEKKNIVPPFLGWHWLQILKIRNLLMVAFPAFLILIHNLKTNSHIHIIEGLASILGCFSLMIAVNLQNDYRDHLSGLDRLHPDSQSRVIQKGWVTAHQMKLGSYFYTIFGVLLGLPAIINEPQVLWAILGVLIFGSIGLLSFKMGLRYRRWSELSVFFLLGPVLTVGLQLSLGGSIDLLTIFYGAFCGWLSLFYLHTKNFEQIMINEKARFNNTVSYLGFEKSKWLLTVFWGVMLFSLMIFYGIDFANGEIQWPLFLGQIVLGQILTFRFLKKLHQLKSPMGSHIRKACFSAKMGVFTLMVIWAIDRVWILNGLF